MHFHTWKSWHPSHTAHTLRMAGNPSKSHTGNLPRTLLHDMLHKRERKFPNSICSTPSLPLQTNHTSHFPCMNLSQYRSRQHSPTPHPLMNRSGGHCKDTTVLFNYETTGVSLLDGLFRNERSYHYNRHSKHKNEPDGSQPKSLRTQDEKEHEKTVVQPGTFHAPKHHQILSILSIFYSYVIKKV